MTMNIQNYNFNLYQHFKDIIFIDKTHEYRNLKTDKKLTSSTQLISKYKNKFEEEYWLKYKTLQADGSKVQPMFPYIKVDGLTIHYKDLDIDTSVLKKQWDDKREKGLEDGSRIHEYLENAWFGKYRGKRISILDKYLFEHRHCIPIRSELIVSDFKDYAGQIDLLLYNTLTKSVEIHDYKTDIEIKFKNKYDTLKKPLNDLDDCNWNKYRIQVNLYRYMLNSVLKVDKMYIIHIPKTLDSYTKLEVPVMEDHIMKLINHDSKRRTLNSKRVN